MRRELEVSNDCIARILKVDKQKVDVKVIFYVVSSKGVAVFIVIHSLREFMRNRWDLLVLVQRKNHKTF